MPWEIADRDYPARAGSRHVSLARAFEELERAEPRERFYLRWIEPTSEGVVPNATS